MKYNNLGLSELAVSEICLGSMTWGSQNTEAEGHDQMDRAFANGVNFIDTAELYPTTPQSAESQGASEAIIGNWMHSRKNRDKVIVASKVCGKGPTWIQNGRSLSAEKNT